MSDADHFAKQLDAFFAKTKYKTQAIFINSAVAVKDSIQNGSPVTGAPGQPVVTGNLKDSWQLTFASPTVADITTNVEYAPTIEYNTRGAKIPRGLPGSTVGGAHSVALTVAGFERLVEIEVKGVADLPNVPPPRKP